MSLVPEEIWWGESNAENSTSDTRIYPFEIKVSEQVSNYILNMF